MYIEGSQLSPTANLPIYVIVGLFVFVYISVCVMVINQFLYIFILQSFKINVAIIHEGIIIMKGML